ncbi:coenzyme F420-dependent NADP oxidoreductase [Leptospira ryugenii]|uniref:Coenzyme F420-dependent NADP oxidoreductase n=1 Tax=Leptospira ryugenii TaxID=1917863 RepID=A0A2P2E430_9LEPT|nr:NAD(P)-binding domain-containing protein [Leptospira ryugenii]GBF51638.1 coenzyme F420-dependent NADP oxidoreductase [Leptospira ryugenii]
MKIAIIGTGNVGGALARGLSKKHEVFIGVRNQDTFKGKESLPLERLQVTSIEAAVQKAETVILATPAVAAIEVARSLGDTGSKVIIDTMNVVMKRGPEGFTNTADAILAHTKSQDIVKCFNTTGANNIANPQYPSAAIDAFVAGNSIRGKAVAKELALDMGFADCIDVGGNDKFELMEHFANFWINLAMFQGLGREIGFKILKR